MVQSWLLSTTKQTSPDGDSVIVLGTSNDEGESDDKDEDYDNEGHESLVQDERDDDDSDYNDGTQRKPKKQAKTIRRKKVTCPATFYSRPAPEGPLACTLHNRGCTQVSHSVRWIQSLDSFTVLTCTNICCRLWRCPRSLEPGRVDQGHGHPDQGREAARPRPDPSRSG